MNTPNTTRFRREGPRPVLLLVLAACIVLSATVPFALNYQHNAVQHDEKRKATLVSLPTSNQRQAATTARSALEASMVQPTQQQANAALAISTPPAESNGAVLRRHYAAELAANHRAIVQDAIAGGKASQIQARLQEARKRRQQREAENPSQALIDLLTNGGEYQWKHNETLYRSKSRSVGCDMLIRLQQPSPPNFGEADGRALECSCWNSTANERCCHRRMHVAHKMGWFLADGYYDFVNIHPNRTNGRVHKNEYPPIGDAKRPQSDYRHIYLVRNIYDALVSGYLYHRSGRECWLHPDGKERAFKNGHMGFGRRPNFNWTIDPPKNKRTLCQYLVEESERDGMKVLMAVSMFNFWNGLFKTIPLAQQASDEGRTVFVCYEDLMDPNHELAALEAATKHYYPAGDVAYNGKLKSLNGPYNGGHATDKNETLRRALKALIFEIDKEEPFHGWIARTHELLPCGKRQAAVTG